MSVCCECCVCCQVEVSVSGRSLVIFLDRDLNQVSQAQVRAALLRGYWRVVVKDKPNLQTSNTTR